MNAENYERVMQLFDRVCELDAGARARVLDDATRGDAWLREQVESLLVHHDRPQNRADVARDELGRLARREATPGGRTDSPPTAMPAMVGQFVPIARLGAGGMGVVYEARQTKPSRVVALKIMHAGLHDRDLVRRCEREAEVLARLQHAGIAQVYESGTFEGQPFLAMERVEGEPLDRFAARLPWRERLALMATVCDAVHYAHTRGVVHRDLKPGNVLVTADGHPKILDFGVARILDDGEQDRSLQTRAGQVIGTLAYMSPDQVEGDPRRIDAQADVYALGVMTYEILAGRLPLELDHLPFLRAIDAIRTAEPPRLERLVPHLRGDVATIVHTACAKDRADRYASAALLATDLRRCLADQPIVARAPTTLYVLQKFARRHRVMVGAAGIALLSLIAGATALAFGLVEAQHERALADSARYEAEEVLRFLEGAIRTAQPGSLEGDPTVRTMLDAMVPTIDASERSPRVVARLSRTAGVAYLALADYDKARTMLERAEHALRTSPDLELELSVAAGFVGLDHEQGHRERARQRIDGLITRAERELGPSHDLTLDLLMRRATLCNVDNDTTQAAADLAVLWQRRSAAAKPDRLVLAEIRHHRADTLSKTADFDAAVLEQEAALAELDALAIGAHPLRVDVLLSIADLRDRLGEFEPAEQAARAALALQEQVFDQPHPLTAYVQQVLATLALRAGRVEDALARYRETLALREALLPGDHPMVAGTLGKIGDCLRLLGRFEESETTFRTALGLSNPATDMLNHGVLAQNFTQTLLARGKLEEAESMQQHARECLQQVRGPDHPDILASTALLGQVQFYRGDLDRAVGTLGELLEQRRRLQGEIHPDVGLAALNLASLHLRRGDIAAALPPAREAGEILEAVLPADHPQRVVNRTILARLLRRSGDLAAAEPLLRAAVAETDRPGLEFEHLDVTAELILFEVERGQLEAASARCDVAFADAERTGRINTLPGMLLRVARASIAVAENRAADAERELRSIDAMLRGKNGGGELEHQDALRLLGDVLVGLGREEEAEDVRGRVGVR